ncbi:FN3 domain-containing metallophosphoesterase family protein [Hwangdonia lutea]|uniref:FN3 domain-containing metallophosphoesterase family protein n=1 Tax=Hwangdonia lutea TaxID=3075823 RepID=A0AA97ER01_9FLAO|nr:FN3 domain-containing metallophosphoesterase family protein [Hwangdonia sp. SCSIO 19198]WOD44605.1 FN3 domain-containing metallophosphoesterase family protein [Hwangdonia sp. SCSIO 19198]
MEKNSKNNRRTFLKDVAKASALTATVGLVSTSTALANNESDLVVSNNNEHTFLTFPYLQNLTSNSVDVMFITNNKAYSWVEFGISNLTQKAHTVSDGFVTAYNRINCIRLNNLEPNTTYKYKVVSKEIIEFKPYDLKYGTKIKSDEFTLKTPKLDEDEVSCVIFNDIHDRPYSFGDLLKVNNRPFDFAIMNGDMFDYEEDEAQIIRNLLTPCASLFANNKPFIMLRGNHETRGKFRSELKNYFSYPTNEYFFSFTKGPVHLTLLDTGEDKPDDDDEYSGIVDFDAFRVKQALWFEKEMQKPECKSAKYKVVFMHIPPYHSGDWHGTLHCRKVFSPLFEKYKIDLVIAGHTHRHGVHLPSKDHSYPIIIGGGPKKGNRTITNLIANKDKLEVKMIDDSGKQVGEYIVTG